MALPFVILIAGGLLAVQYWTSDKIALASAGARIVEPNQAPELYAIVQRLCMTAGLPMPRIAIVPTDMPNAFATGRSPKHAVVAVTQGLLDRLEPHELEGVLAHELSHVAHRDVAIMTHGELLRDGRRVHHPLGLLLRRRVRRRLRRRPRRQQQLGPVVHGHPARVGGRLRDLVRPHPDALALPRVRGRPRRGHPDQVARRAWPRRSSRSPARWAASRSATCAWPRA